MDFFHKIISLFSRIFSKETLYFIMEPKFEGWLLIIRNAFFFISGILLLLSIILLVVSGWIRRRYAEDLYEAASYKSYGAKQSAKEWKKISSRIKGGGDSNYKLAIIEADDLLEERLRVMGYKGSKMQDLLDQVPGTIVPNIGEVAQAHRLRNNIVHDPDYKLDLEEAGRAMKTFERALQELGAI